MTSSGSIHIRFLWSLLLVLFVTDITSACNVSYQPSNTSPAIVSPPPPPPPFPESEAYELTDTTIRIHLAFSQAEQRRIDVNIVIPTRNKSHLTVMIPVWAPGSYLVREFAKNIISPAAYTQDGEGLDLSKVTKNRMRVATRGAKRIHLRYQVQASELSVRTSFVGWDYAVINPASVVFTDVEASDVPHFLEVALPQRWPDVFTALAPVEVKHSELKLSASGQRRAFLAKNFEELVDAPLLIGRAYTHAFSIKGIPHYLAHVGDLNGFPRKRAQRDVPEVVAAHAKFWGHFPYKNFHFLSVLASANGGLEHRDSTLIMMDPHRIQGLASWQEWLRLVSHELFHAWNGKRLRPQNMGPIDFEREAYTQSLWFIEGITAYYDNLLLCRAGLMSDSRYLKILSNAANDLAMSPGEEVQSLAQSSFDTWIKWYRPDAETLNTTVSYYLKGALLGWVIDAKIREQTKGQKSLDDVMRLAYRRFSEDTGYSDNEIYDVFAEVGGQEVVSFLRDAVNQPKRLTYEVPFRVFGLRHKVVAEVTPTDPLDQRAEQGNNVSLGIETQAQEDRLIVKTVLAQGSAWRAGIAPGDEIVAVDGYRVPLSGLATLIKRYIPGEMVEVLLARRGRMVRLEVELGTKPPTITFEVDPEASSKAKHQRSMWLMGP